MEIIGRCFDLKESQQGQYAAREVKRIGIVLGCVLIGMVVLLLAIRVPMAIFSGIIPLLLIVFGIALGARYLVMQKMAAGYLLCFDEDRISSTFDKDKVGAVVSGMTRITEARYGSRMNQFISWKNIDYITVNGNGMKIYSVKYDMMNGNGLIIIPAFIDDYEDVKTFFERNYKAKLNK